MNSRWCANPDRAGTALGDCAPYHLAAAFCAATPKGHPPRVARSAGPVFVRPYRAGAKMLPATRTLHLRNSPAGAPLKPEYDKAFEYSDCWVDDARLVVLNAWMPPNMAPTYAPAPKSHISNAATGFGISKLLASLPLRHVPWPMQPAPRCWTCWRAQPDISASPMSAYVW